MPDSILEIIVKKKREEVAVRKKAVGARDFQSFEEYQRPRSDFGAALIKPDGVSIIAEIKKASPSKGVIRDDFNPALIAKSYQENGASALSVLTDEPFFKGSLMYLQEVSAMVTLPLLRKDFIIDPYQIAEARAWGADAVLLIVKILDKNQLYDLHAAAREIDLQVLVECYDHQDWDKLDFDVISIVGVNNRNLDTFEVDLHRGISILENAPAGTTRVSESGLGNPEDLHLLKDSGIHSALIGEHFMRAEDPGNELARFTAIFPESPGPDAL